MNTDNAAHDRAGSWLFLREAARDIRATGALAPSSRALAHALTGPVRARRGRPLNILEAGAGTGAVTRALLSQLPAGSHLDVVEANPRFATALRHLAATHPDLAGHAQRVHVHTRRVEELDTRRRYDVIVSGLPFANFDPGQVDEIMHRYLGLLHPGGTLTYFAYRGTRKARTLLAARTETLRHRAVEAVLTGYQRRYGTGSRTVWANLPPAKVWQLTRPVPAAATAPYAATAAGR
ncbi:methyltransferase domain-containing protein [Dactylosporangium aurantiacum]|uniref:Methyltransferase domain-containing protein n=1 Tax=Dactylosporangium aurantiacum TaxID=35754 RepID=A0A9Q9I9J5_9ACTN|nr:methyltransferase [Dactylosporangium aurantiacum]MDG6109289.1 methyltransferase domain-containing protein [Dactylosporangium aurantiacum]UWZ50375.1 methyltransferase domain-containing protein [Dactylosporangium aurantiacum]